MRVLANDFLLLARSPAGFCRCWPELHRKTGQMHTTALCQVRFPSAAGSSVGSLSSSALTQVEIIRSFTAKQPDELSLQVADVVLIYQRVSDGEWKSSHRALGAPHSGCEEPRSHPFVTDAHIPCPSGSSICTSLSLCTLYGFYMFFIWDEATWFIIRKELWKVVLSSHCPSDLVLISRVLLYLNIKLFPCCPYPKHPPSQLGPSSHTVSAASLCVLALVCHSLTRETFPSGPPISPPFITFDAQYPSGSRAVKVHPDTCCFMRTRSSLQAGMKGRDCGTEKGAGFLWNVPRR